MSGTPLPSKAERLQEIFNRLNAAPAVATYEEAYTVLCDTMNAVEDELTDIPYNLATWMTDGRLYPPQLDNRREIEGKAGSYRFRSRLHVTTIGADGSIEIKRTNGALEFYKPGK